MSKPVDFAVSVLRLSQDRNAPTAWILALAVFLFVAWCCWATLSKVTLDEVSSEARVELDGATYPISSPLLGRVVRAALRVGQQVHRGDVLVELDSTPQALEITQGQVQAQGLEAQVGALRHQIAAERAAGSKEQVSAGLSEHEARDRIEQARQAAQLATEDLARVRTLAAQHLIPARDLDKAESDERRLRAALSELTVAASRVPEEQAARSRERDARIARLEGEIATLEAQGENLAAETTRLGYEIQRHRIQAAIDGSIGEAATLHEGAVISEGERVGSIIPKGSLIIVAQYPAQAAFGRISPGQLATLRLDGFPWAEFGTVPAKVTRVAEEIRDGKVRVELALVGSASFRGVLEHGMPGRLEIAVERVSPWQLLLRTAGEWLTGGS